VFLALSLQFLIARLTYSREVDPTLPLIYGVGDGHDATLFFSEHFSPERVCTISFFILCTLAHVDNGAMTLRLSWVTKSFLISLISIFFFPDSHVVGFFRLFLRLGYFCGRTIACFSPSGMDWHPLLFEL